MARATRRPKGNFDVTYGQLLINHYNDRCFWNMYCFNRSYICFQFRKTHDSFRDLAFVCVCHHFPCCSFAWVSFSPNLLKGKHHLIKNISGFWQDFPGEMFQFCQFGLHSGDHPDSNAFRRLCQERSECSSADSAGQLCGDLGWVSRGTLGPWKSCEKNTGDSFSRLVRNP